MKILRKLREIEKLSRKDIIEKLDISESSIKKYETGRDYPYFTSLIRISIFFQLSIDCIINDEVTNRPKNLKLIKKAQLIDNSSIEKNINLIINNIETYLLNTKTTLDTIKLDQFSDQLSNDFHSNLKIIRTSQGLSYEQIGKPINISSQMIYRYETNQYPPFSKIKPLTDQLDISAHSLCTGEKLNWKFKNKDFYEYILIADQYCTLDEHRMLIYIIDKMLANI